MIKGSSLFFSILYSTMSCVSFPACVEQTIIKQMTQSDLNKVIMLVSVHLNSAPPSEQLNEIFRRDLFV